MKILLLLLIAAFTGGNLRAQVTIETIPFASGFSSPVDLTNAGDERLFVVEQVGRIRIIDGSGNTLNASFLNINSRLSSSAGEQGLLGLAFHPDYANNGFFYVNYTGGNGETRISRFNVNPSNPNQAIAASELVLLTIEQPYGNHNGGDLAFGPDGYLYVGTGDGGSGGDPDQYSQNRQSLLGKMLRLDVTTNPDAYTIPTDNPFAMDDETLDEIWALGIRNPWRFSFDRKNGDLWMGDVGQNAREEINRQRASSTGGENYGWKCREGTIAFSTTANGCTGNPVFTEPIFDYAHASGNGCSVTGGIVYRGCEYPALYGHYVFADFCSGRFWTSVPNTTGNYSTGVALNSNLSVSGFGEDINGELYVLDHGGDIYRVKRGNAFVLEVGENGGTLNALSNFAVDSYQWYLNNELIDGANLSEYTATENGTYIVEVTYNEGNCTVFSEEVMIVVNSTTQTNLGLLSFKAFPAPFSEELTIELEFPTATSLTATLLDGKGKKITSKKYEGQTLIRDVFLTDHLSDGVYYLKIDTEFGQVVKKLVRMK